MAKQKFQQSVFFGGMQQTPLLPSSTGISDCENVDLTSEYGAVTLSRLPADNSPATPLKYNNFINKDGSGTEDVFRIAGTDIIVGNTIFTMFSDWSYIDNGYPADPNAVREVPATSYSRALLHAICVPTMGDKGRIFAFTKATTGGGFDVFTADVYDNIGGTAAALSTQFNNLNRTNLPAAQKNINPNNTGGTHVSSVYIDNAVYVSLGDRIYKIEDVAGIIVVNEVLRIQDGFSIRKMIPHGDYFYVYCSYTDPDIGHQVNLKNRTSRYVWNRGADVWEKRQDIPGALFDAVEHKEVDYIFVDDKIGYFNGEVFTVLKTLPAIRGKTAGDDNVIDVVVPGSACSVGNYVTFLTTGIVPTDPGGSSIAPQYGSTLWTLGRDQDDNPISLQKYASVLSGYNLSDELFTNNDFGDVYIANPATPVIPTIAISTQNSVRIYATTAYEEGSVDQRGVFRSVIQTIHSRETNQNYRSRGFFTTCAVREDSTQKEVQSIYINAEIPANTSIKVYLYADQQERPHPDLVDIPDHLVATLTSKDSQIQAETIGVTGVPRCAFFKVGIELLSSDGVNSPRIYGIGVNYDTSDAL